MKIDVVISETVEKEIIVEAYDFFHVPDWVVPEGFVCAKCENVLSDRLCVAIKTDEGTIYMHKHCFHSYFGVQEKKEESKKKPTSIGRKK